MALILIISVMFCSGLGSVWLGELAGKTRLLKMFELGAAMLAASGAMVAAYIGFRQGQAADNRDKEQREREKLEETFRLIAKWDDPHFLAARTLSIEIGKKKNDMTPTQLVEKVENTPELRSSVSLMLNYFDFIRLSVKHDRVHVEIMKRQLGHVAEITLDRFEAWIKTQDSVYQTDFNEFRRLIT